jgi:ribonucleoside-diphosphate reductase alpha chain
MVAQSNSTQSSFLDANPVPEGSPLNLPTIDLTENARQVLLKRYVRRGADGQPVETVEEMFWRVASHIAAAETERGTDVDDLTHRYYKLLTSKRFFPNSPTFTGAGTPLGQLAACFVLPIADNMGRDPAGIFQTLRDAALIQQTGGGNGFSFSRLRPKGSLVKTSAGQATGPVGFLRVYDNAFGEVAQGGSRRGANMAVLRVDHPDIEDFVCCKTNENQITNFNISVAITDAFMKAVRDDAEWTLRFPDITDPRYKGFSGTFEQAEAAGIPFKKYKTMRARTLYEMIVKQSHTNGEPGVLFIDAANRSNPIPTIHQLEATNPCGEQWLGPYENCCLGSVNLARHLGPDHTVDWETLRESVKLATYFLDDVIDANAYVSGVPQLKEAALQARRIGLGIMGLADLMYHVRVRYGSPAGEDFAGQVMEFVRYTAMQTSIELARERGSFPAIKDSIYNPANLIWAPPVSLIENQQDWGRPTVDWKAITAGITQYGIRNAAQTTVAPTGTIATVAGCEGYGCEPVFALAYVRHFNDHGEDVELTFASPAFEQALIEEGYDDSTRQDIFMQVMREGTCQNVNVLSSHVKDIFVVSQDISAEEHVRMQAVLQAFVDNSLSKTVNFPETATVDDVASVYMSAWELGCKGITVYVTGSRDKVVLETHATARKRSTSDEETVIADESGQMQIWAESRKPRPRSLIGRTYEVNTPLGKAFITINENGGAQPFEVFINTAKAGSDTASVSEAIGRLISYVLRLSSPIEPAQRLTDLSRQLAGIGGGRSLGFGPNRVRSLPDGVAQILEEYLNDRASRLSAEEKSRLSSMPLLDALKDGSAIDPIAPADENLSDLTTLDSPLSTQAPKTPAIGDLCPECGEATLVNEEGCCKCYSCGFSQC